MNNKLINRINDRKKETFTLYPEFPKKNLLIELSNCCNYKCIFCANRKMTRKIGFMDFELLTRVLKDCYLLGSREVGFYTTGEPLVYKQIFDAIALAKSIGFTYIYITTNGYLCNLETFKKLVDSGLDSIKFSINALDKCSYRFIHGRDGYDKVINNLKDVYDYKLKYAQKVNVFVSYIATTFTSQPSQMIKQHFEGICDDVAVINVRNQSGLTPENLTLLSTREDKDKLEGKRLLPCHYVFNTVNITYEGYLTACCTDYQNYLVYGNLNKMPLYKCWHNRTITRLRRQHLKHRLHRNLCRNCIYTTDKLPKPLNKNYAVKFNKTMLSDEEVKSRIKEYKSFDNQ